MQYIRSYKIFSKYRCKKILRTNYLSFLPSKILSRKQLVFIQETQKLVDTLENKNKGYFQGEELKNQELKQLMT